MKISLIEMITVLACLILQIVLLSLNFVSSRLLLSNSVKVHLYGHLVVRGGAADRAFQSHQAKTLPCAASTIQVYV